MMLKQLCLIPLLAIGLIFMGCKEDSSEFDAKSNTLAITHANECDLLSLDKGHILSIILPGNPSTGYGWTIKRLPTILKLLPDSVQYPTEKISPPLLGGEQQYSWRFLATTVGQDKLELIYSRPWKKNDVPTKTFSCHISVK